MSIYRIKQCVVCDKSFKTNCNNGKYCSIDCRREARRRGSGKYHKEHRIKERENQNRYFKQNRDEVLERGRRYYQNNKQKVCDRIRVYLKTPNAKKLKKTAGR